MRLPLLSNYEDTRLDADIQQSLNVFPQSKMGLRQFYGLVEFANFLAGNEPLNDNAGEQLTANGENLFVSVTPGGSGRGLHVMNGVVYIVSGASLYSVNSAQETAFIGTIANDPQPVVMSNDNTELMITTGSTAYSYTVAGGLVTITDTDIATPYTNAYLDSRRIYDKGDEDQFGVTDLNDATSADALNFAEAEAFGDQLLSIVSLNQLVYLMGKESTEAWYTSGVGRPPLDRQAVLEHGIIGRYARDSIDGRLYFIDHEKAPSLLQGTQYSPLIVNEAGRQDGSALGKEWNSYSEAAMAAARVSCYSIEQENFVDFHFPTISKTWTYHESSQTFFERTFKSVAAVNVYNRVLMADYENGKLYELSASNYQNDGVAITRRKDLPMVSAEMLGADSREILLDRLRLNYQTSASSEISVTLSKDLSTFSNPRTFTVSGNGRKTLTGFGKLSEGILRIETSANAKVDFVDMSAEITLLDD